MTPEQKQAVSDCIRAFNIPLDAADFKLTIKTDHTFGDFGQAPNLSAHVEIAHALMSPADVKP
jgi:hypothetical protein